EPKAEKTPSAQAEVVRIGFRRGSTYLDPDERMKIDQVAAKLRSGRFKALIIGNSDSSGGSGVNQDLALVRGELVAKELRRAKIPDQLLSVEGAGATSPLSSNDADQGRASNRRVDVYLVSSRL